jgi:hypothetical protein
MSLFGLGTTSIDIIPVDHRPSSCKRKLITTLAKFPGDKAGQTQIYIV